MADRGRFLVIDGPEGSGKTTQVKRLAEHIEARGHTLHVFREPGGTAAGERIRALLLDPALGTLDPMTEILLFLASRVQLLTESVRPALGRGDVVLLDRFYHATIAYQVYGLGRAGLPENVEDIIRGVNGGLEPDRTWILEVPPEVGMKRLEGSRDRIEARDMDFHRRVLEGFRAQARDDPGCVRLVDATRTADEVFETLREEADRVL